MRALIRLCAVLAIVAGGLIIVVAVLLGAVVVLNAGQAAGMGAEDIRAAYDNRGSTRLVGVALMAGGGVLGALLALAGGVAWLLLEIDDRLQLALRRGVLVRSEATPSV